MDVSGGLGSCHMRSAASWLHMASRPTPARSCLMHGSMARPFLFIPSRLARLATTVERKRFENDRWHNRVGNEGFRGPKRAGIDPLRSPAPALPVQMEVVPYHAQIQIEHVPADALAGL